MEIGCFECLIHNIKQATKRTNMEQPKSVLAVTGMVGTIPVTLRFDHLPHWLSTQGCFEAVHQFDAILHFLLIMHEENLAKDKVY